MSSRHRRPRARSLGWLAPFALLVASAASARIVSSGEEVVTSAEQCAQFENYAGAEPEGYAQYCIEEVAPAPWVRSDLDPGDVAYAQDIGFVSDNFVVHAQNDFPGQTPIGPNTRPLFAMDFDPTGTTLYAIDNTSRELGTYDLTTGAFTPIAVVSGIPAADNMSGLTIDPATGAAWVSGLSASGMTLYSFDLTTATATVIGSDATTPLMIDIAIGPQGVMYGHEIGTDSIYTIDTTTGLATLVGPTGVNSNFAQGMDFDNADGTLYAYTYQGGGANQYGTINLATGALTPLAASNPQGEFEGASQTTMGGPVIAVDPTSITEFLLVDQTTTVDLNIENLGTTDLDWAITEAEPWWGGGEISFLGSRVRRDSLTGGWVSSAADLLGTGALAAPDYSKAADASFGAFGTILDQAPNQANGLFSDASCSICPTGQQSVAENFVVTTPVALQQIRIWTGYHPGNTPTTSDIFTVILHADAAGLPGAVIYTESNVASTRVQTGVVLFGVDEWLATLTLAAPQNLAAGTYWIEIFNDSAAGGSPDDVFWETGDLDAVHGIFNNAFAQQTPGVTWLAGNPTGDSAVQLDGPQSPCTSPSDVPWLSVDTDNGTTAPAAVSTVVVTLDSAGLAPGTYEALLCIDSNDPATPTVEVPVTLAVDSMPFLDGFESGDTSRWSATQN